MRRGRALLTATDCVMTLSWEETRQRLAALGVPRPERARLDELRRLLVDALRGVYAGGVELAAEESDMVEYVARCGGRVSERAFAERLGPLPPRPTRRGGGPPAAWPHVAAGKERLFWLGVLLRVGSEVVVPKEFLSVFRRAPKGVAGGPAASHPAVGLEMRFRSEGGPELTLRQVLVLEGSGLGQMRRELRPYVSGWVSPRAAEVPPRQVRALARLLGRRGYRPAGEQWSEPLATIAQPGLARRTLLLVLASVEAWQHVAELMDLQLGNLPTIEGLWRWADEETAEAAREVAASWRREIEKALEGGETTVKACEGPARRAPSRRLVAAVEKAMREGRCLALAYRPESRPLLTHRVVEPYWLEGRGSRRYVVAYCRWRQALRRFRLDRVEWWRLLRERFAGDTLAHEIK